MKRTPLKRKTPLRSRSSKVQQSAAPCGDVKPLKRPGLKRSRIAPRSKTGRYARRDRQREYMLWVKTQPCLVCGRKPTEAAHTGSRGFGQKAPDQFVIPLCPDHHRHRRDALDVAGARRFQELHGIVIRAEIERLWGLFLRATGKMALPWAANVDEKTGITPVFTTC